MAPTQLFVPVPPPPEVTAAMAAIPGLQLAPTVLITQDGPARHTGPEAAGAILWLQATFLHEDGARNFWDAAVPLMVQLSRAPGFIRRYSFFSHMSIHLVALWQTIGDAEHFAASPAHREASRALFAGRWQHSHFAALWELHHNHGRLFFCEVCDGITEAPAAQCRSCGAPILDVYGNNTVAP